MDSKGFPIDVHVVSNGFLTDLHMDCNGFLRVFINNLMDSDGCYDVLPYNLNQNLHNDLWVIHYNPYAYL